MNYAIHRISLDVTDDSPSQLTIHAKQGDNAKVLIISLLDHKKNYQIAKGSVASFIAKKANGVWLEHPCEIDYNSNKVIYTFQDKTVSTAGTIDCEIHISAPKAVTKEYLNDEGKIASVEEVVVEKLTTASFVIAVHDNILSGLTDETEEAELLPNLITKATSLLATLEENTIPDAETATENAITATSNAEEATENAIAATERAEKATSETEEATAEATDVTNRANTLVEEIEAKLENGEFDGTPCTHSWNGTVLTVTSASGTSSADLEGRKGDKGDKGDTIGALINLNELYGYKPNFNSGEYDSGSYNDGIGYTQGVDIAKKKYKIFCKTDWEGNTASEITYTFAVPYWVDSPLGIGGGYAYNNVSVTIKLDKGHRDYCVFEFLNATASISSFSNNSYTCQVEVYYELNGKEGKATGYAQFSNEPETDESGSYAWGIDRVKISYVKESYLYDDNITIQGLKGDTPKAIRTQYKSTNQDGSYSYELIFDTGDKVSFVSPRGAQGEAWAKIVSTEYIDTDENGGYVYKLTFDNGETAEIATPKGNKGDKGDKGDLGGTYPLGETSGTAYEGHKGKANAEDIKNLYALAEDKWNMVVLKTEQAYTSRITADGSDIFDQVAKLEKIQGSTVVDTETGAIKNAYFKGIKSTGVNLIQFPESFTWKSVRELLYYYNLPAGTYTISCESCETTGTQGTGPVVSLFNMDKNKEEGRFACKKNSFTCTLSGGRYDIRFYADYQWGASQGHSATVNKLMLTMGSTALPYSPYQVDESFMLDNAVELGAYDYIDIETQKLVKRTQITTLTGAENWKVLGVTPAYKYGYQLSLTTKGYVQKIIYPSRGDIANFVLSGGSLETGYAILRLETDTLATVDELKAYLEANPLTIAYKKVAVEEAISLPLTYKAWENGIETVIQGDTDNSAYGAMPTITQVYYANAGGTSDE